jgi:hypothetical protein
LHETPENLRRAFKGLAAYGVKVEQNHIKITDLDGLTRYADEIHSLTTIQLRCHSLQTPCPILAGIFQKSGWISAALLPLWAKPLQSLFGNSAL